MLQFLNDLRGLALVDGGVNALENLIHVTLSPLQRGKVVMVGREMLLDFLKNRSVEYSTKENGVNLLNRRSNETK